MLYQKTFDSGSVHYLKISFISIVVRAFAILAKFFLIAYLGKNIGIYQYGMYGVITTSLIFGVYFIGMDIYAFTTRELPKKEVDPNFIISNQFVIYCILYFIFIPFVILFLSQGFLDKKYLLYFTLLLILEHFSQEVIRVFFALRYVLLANVLIFLKRTFWILIFILLSMYDKSFLNLDFILKIWSINHILLFFICCFFMYKINLLPIKMNNVKIKDIAKILKGSYIFFGVTICLQLINNSSVYFIKFFLGYSEVGVYTFFLSIVSFLDVFIYTTIISIFLPKVIEHRKDKQGQVYVRQMNWGIIITAFVGVGIFLICVKPFLGFVQKQIFLENINIFFILLAGFFIRMLSYVPHYKLYINHKEKYIFYASLCGCFLNVILNFILIPIYGIKVAAISLTTSVLVVSCIKSFFAFYKFEMLEGLALE